VDSCIADEIKELNNVYNIDTHFSCCGHGIKENSIIIVRDTDIDKMRALGYLKVDNNTSTTRTVCYKRNKYWDRHNKGRIIKRWIKICDYLQVSFRPKSKCTCEA